MTDFVIVDLTKVKNRKRREIAQIKHLLRLRRHNAWQTENYINKFGSSENPYHLEIMKKHLYDLCRSIIDMEQELYFASMEAPYQQQLFNN